MKLKGFSLVELIVAMSLFSIVATMGTYYTIQMLKLSQENITRQEMQNETRDILRFITRKIKEAKSVEVVSNTTLKITDQLDKITEIVYCNIPVNGNCIGKPGKIIYQYDGGSWVNLSSSFLDFDGSALAPVTAVKSDFVNFNYTIKAGSEWQYTMELDTTIAR